MRISVILEALTADFETDMKRAQKSADRAFAEMKRSASSINNFLGNALTAGIVGAIGGIGYAVKSAVDEMDRIGKTAQKIGVTTEALSALEYAAKLADVEAGALQSSITKLAKAQADAAQGGKEQLEVFRLLGVEFRNADGTLRNADEVFADVADRFADLEDGAGKTALAVKLFGRSGAELIPLLNGGAAGLRAAREEAEQFGIVVSSEAAKAAEQFNDNLTRLAQVGKGAGIELATYLLPTIAELSDEAVSLAKDPAFRDDLANAIRSIGEAAITGARGIATFTNNVGFLIDEAKQLFGVIDDEDWVRWNEELDQAKENLAALRGERVILPQAGETIPIVLSVDTSLIAAAEAEVRRLEQKVQEAESRIYDRSLRQSLKSADEANRIFREANRELDAALGKSSPRFVDTAEADRAANAAAKEAAREARRQAKELAAEQEQYTQTVRDLKLRALGEESRAVAALQDDYADLAEAVRLGVTSQEQAAEIAAGLAEQWQKGATDSIRLELLTDEQRAVEELQAKYISLQNQIASGAITPEVGAERAAGLAEQWAEEQQALYEQQFAALSAGLLTEEEEIAASYDRRRDAILEATKLTEDEKTDLLVAAEADRQQQLADLERARLNEGLDQTAYYLDAVSTLMQSGNSKLFAIGKAAAIAEATVKGYQAVVNALAEVPYPLNFAAAAVVGAATAVQIANIASTNYSGAYDIGGDIPAAAIGLVAERGPEIVRIGREAALITEPTLIKGPAHITSRVQTDRILKQQQESLRFAGLFDTGGFIPSGSVGLVGERGTELAAMSAAVPGRASMPARLERASAAEPPKFRQVIVFSDDQIADALGSDASEQKLITWATRNRTKLRSILT